MNRRIVDLAELQQSCGEARATGANALTRLYKCCLHRNMKAYSPLLFVAACLAIAACSETAPPAPPQPQVAVAGLLQRNVTDWDDYVGRFEAIDDVEIIPRVSGNVTPMITLQTLLEWQRDWARRDHYDALMDIVKEHFGAYGMGVDYAYMMVHKVPERALHGPVVDPLTA